MAGRKIPISNRISNGGFSIAMSVLRGGKIYGLSVFSIMQFVFLNLTSPTQKKNTNFDSLTAKKQKCSESRWSWELRFAEYFSECAGRLNWGSNSEHDSGLGHPSHDLLPFVAVNPTLSVPKNGWNCEWDNFNKFQKQKTSLQKDEEDPTNKNQKPQTNNHMKRIHNGSFKPANLPSAPCWCHDRVREGLLPRKPGWTGWFKVHLWDVLRSEWVSLCHRITTSSRLFFAFLNFQQSK